MSLLTQEVLFLLVGAIILLGSGLGILGLVPPFRRTLTVTETVPCALLISSGVSGIWLLVGQLLGLSIGPWAITLLVASIALAAGGSIMRWRARRVPTHRTGSRGLQVLLGMLALLALVLMWPNGGSLGPVHDSLDFVAFVNETLTTGELAPRSPIYRAGTDVPPDPRRGSFHTQISAICLLSGTDPTNGWRWLPRLLVPLAILGLGAMFRPWIGTTAAGLATILFIATTFFTSDRFIQNIGYASRFGWICGWAGLLALGKGLALRAKARWRQSNALLALAAASPAILLFVHLLSGFQVILALGCAGLAVWADRGSNFEARRSIWFVLLGGVALLVPVVLYRLAQSTEVANPLFDHLYGVVFVADGWPILHPQYLWDRLGYAGLTASLLGLGLIPSIRRSRAAGFLAFSTIVPLLILFFPPLVRIFLGAHAHSMLFRVILTIPAAGTLAWVVVNETGRLGDSDLLRRIWAFVILAIVTVALVGQAISTRSGWSVPEKYRTAWHENASLIRALEFLEETFPETQTVLSDPMSSYAIPAYTRHDTVTPFHQHSSPTDPSVAERIIDVQEALNGRVGIERTFRVLRRYGVDQILLNQGFERYQAAYFFFLSPLAYPEQLTKFMRRPDLFRQIYESGGVRIFQVRDPGPEAVLPGDPPNPSRIPDPETAPLLACGPVELLEFQVPTKHYAPGEPLRFEIVWRRTGEPYRLPIVCDLKLQHAERPAGFDSPLLGRFARWREENKDRSVLRFGRSIRPLVTFYPDFLWAPGETYLDEYWLHSPPHARNGPYEVWIRMRIEPYAPTEKITGLLGNELGEGWIRLGLVQIGS